LSRQTQRRTSDLLDLRRKRPTVQSHRDRMDNEATRLHDACGRRGRCLAACGARPTFDRATVDSVSGWRQAGRCLGPRRCFSRWIARARARRRPQRSQSSIVSLRGARSGCLPCRGTGSPQSSDHPDRRRRRGSGSKEGDDFDPDRLPGARRRAFTWA